MLRCTEAMDFHRKSSCTKELRFRTLVLLVWLVFVNTIYCQQFNSTNSSRFTVDCENEKHAENQSELSYIDCKCWHDKPDGHSQHERITKECSSNKTNGKKTEICADHNPTYSTRHPSESVTLTELIFPTSVS